MKTVICINDKNLPQGAKVVKDKEYEEAIESLEMAKRTLEDIADV